MIKVNDNMEVMHFGKIIEGLFNFYKSSISARKNKKYDYDGYDTYHSSILATSQSVKKRLSKESFEYSVNEHNEHPINILLTAAVQLGIQQGINMCQKNPTILINSSTQNKIIDYIEKITTMKSITVNFCGNCPFLWSEYDDYSLHDCTTNICTLSRYLNNQEFVISTSNDMEPELDLLPVSWCPIRSEGGVMVDFKPFSMEEVNEMVNNNNEENYE